MEDYWYLDALCREHPYYWWDAEETVSNKQRYPHLDKARSVCLECPVFEACDIAGRDEPTGIWAAQPKGAYIA